MVHNYEKIQIAQTGFSVGKNIQEKVEKPWSIGLISSEQK